DRLHILLHFDYPGVAHGGAAAWTKSYGKGRVFYTALGHDETTWTDERFRKHLLGGLRDVLGLEASTGKRPDSDGWVGDHRKVPETVEGQKGSRDRQKATSLPKRP